MKQMPKIFGGYFRLSCNSKRLAKDLGTVRVGKASAEKNFKHNYYPIVKYKTC